MKTLVVYDSAYGNTEKIARAVGAAIGEDVKVIKADAASVSGIESLDLLIAGSPTYGGRATPAMREFLDKIPKNVLRGVKVASFDTRIPANWVKIFGFAAGKIAGKLKSKGGVPVLKPEPFLVSGTEGPLVEGEIERAADWGKEIVKNL